MKKKFSLLFLLVFAFSIVSTSTNLYAWEFAERPFSFHEHEKDSNENFLLLELYDKGVFLLVSGDYYQARDNFTYILDSQGISEEMMGTALWGRVWANAFLGDKVRLVDDLDVIAQLIGLNEICECQPDASLAFSGKSHKRNDTGIFFISSRSNQSDFLLIDSGCFNTVDACSAVMKNMCAALRDPGIKVTLELFIDGLAKKGRECCRAGGFWDQCVKKMVDTTRKWNTFGIPADPYWD